MRARNPKALILNSQTYTRNHYYTQFFMQLFVVVFFRLNGDLVLTGCYDNTVNIWSLKGEKKLVIPGISYC